MPSPSFVTRFAAQVRSGPHAPAVFWNGRTVSYEKLGAAADEAHSRLAALDLAKGAPVCVPAYKSPWTLALLLACFRDERRVLLPSPELGGAALEDLCRQAGCAQVLTAAADGPDTALTVTARSTADADGTDAPVLPDGPGLILTTSGSTGTPKGVVLDVAGVDAFVDWCAETFSIGPGVRVLNFAPLNFDLCLLDVWSPLATGGCAELVDPERAVEGDFLTDLCVGREPHVIQAVPLFFRLVTATAAARGVTFPSVRHVMFTGDATPPALAEAVAAVFPGARMWNIYGCTETNDSFLYEISLDEVREHGVVPIGQPIEGVGVRIVDADGQAVTGAGSGELVVATPFQAHGYLDATTTARTWQDGWYRTGDLVRRDARGVMFLGGRIDHQVKVRGVRTNLEEVERVVRAHPQVDEAAVVAVPDEVAAYVLHAVVRRMAGSALNSLQLRMHCAAELPRTAIPGTFAIGEDALPRTSTGKVDRRALLARGPGGRGAPNVIGRDADNTPRENRENTEGV
jgi:acyl-coenzyme A synthetase/AMP-(fatty) acid ligase